MDLIREKEEVPTMIMECAWCADPTDDGPPLCPRCLDRAAADIAALPDDLAALDAATPLHGAPLQRVTGTHTPALPIDLTADALRRAIVWTCGVWEPPVREAAGWPPADENVSPARLVTRAATVLSSSVSAFAALPYTWGYPDGPEAGCVARSGLYGVLSAKRLHERAVRHVGATPAATHLPGWCPRCAATALTATTGAVTCAACGHHTTLRDYRENLSLTAE